MTRMRAMKARATGNTVMMVGIGQKGGKAARGQYYSAEEFSLLI